ncbi:hypothetical protein N7478_007835 [Penicillium angulare]|uniref:uncharacterized protein n=1 Tax=Penicillium angulare TaxID=116970 RepID=UPI00254022FE|nr:uncharacterized protein N7478_007835 [Penicillium angulare]KAJ5272710.1 hypothetical protein N7478_007835 [Penicillium angulare]
MGFASKIAASQNNSQTQPPSQGLGQGQQNMPSNQGTYGGAPPAGYTGGPPAALRPGGYPPQQQQQQQPQQAQYQAFPGSPPPNQGSGYPPYGGSPAQQYQPYHTPSPAATSYSRAPPQQPSPYPASAQGYARPPPPPPQGQPYGSGSPYPGQQSPYPGQQPPYPGQQQPPYPGEPSPYPGQQPAYNQGQYPPPQGSPYPPQGSPYPGAQGRPGPPPGPPSGQYGAPGGGAPPQAAPPTPQQVSAYRQLLIATIQEKNLQAFYPPERLNQLVDSLANNAPGKLQRLIQEWSVPMEVATDVMKLALFDVILYVDDSGSIEFEEKGLRKDQLRQILGIVATAASTFDEDGISVRFMNSQESGDGIRNAEDVNRLVSRVRFAGLTPLGTSLRSKVLDPMVVGPARAGRLEKPVLVITITDGQPAGEPHSSVSDAIRHAIAETSRTRYGRGAVSFQFSQVGNDQRAREFLGDLDEDPEIGNFVDCTSNFEVEQDEMSRANPPVHLTRELWCAKLMLGAIDASYDTKDEKASGRSSGGDGRPPPPASYGGGGGYNQGPPPGGPPPGYGAPPAGYQSGPPQGSYTPQPGYQQGPPPQQQQQQQQQYGGASRGSPYGQPQGYGYPAGAGGYPPPPRRY